MLDSQCAMAITSNFSRLFWLKSSRRLFQACTIGSLSLLTLMSSVCLPPLFGQTDQAVAQENDQAVLNDDELFTRYVRAAWEVERERRRMMGEVKQLTGGSLPANVCANLDRLSSTQRSPVQAICNDFAQFASQIVTQKYGLSIWQFNVFQRRVGEPAMRQRINDKIQALNLK